MRDVGDSRIAMMRTRRQGARRIAIRPVAKGLAICAMLEELP
ncbi:hypothetical protein ACVIKO_005747 [Rhizobium ruizarguesonis]|jgi:hypothetical protein